MKKIALIATVALAMSTTGVVFAAGEAKPAYKAPTKAKRVTQKVVPKKIIKKVEENEPIADDPNVVLTPADLEMAKAVYTGNIKCELGASVDVEADANKPGYFNISTGKQKFRMHPVNSRTGAVRLEDPQRGAMWLQLGNKSMLMSQKLGERLADECQAVAQLAVSEQMKKSPPKSLFEPDSPTAPVAPGKPAGK